MEFKLKNIASKYKHRYFVQLKSIENKIKCECDDNIKVFLYYNAK